MVRRSPWKESLAAGFEVAQDAPLLLAQFQEDILHDIVND